MRKLFLGGAVLVCLSCCWAQTATPVVLGAGNVNPSIFVAPGQLLTLFVQATDTLAPLATATFSVTYSNGTQMPVIQVVTLGETCMDSSTPNCADTVGVTVQVPFGIPVFCLVCGNPAYAGGITVSVNGTSAFTVSVEPLQDQVHFLTSCDLIVAGISSAPTYGGLPCSPIVTHADGRPVSATIPASPGEEVVAYATGLGETIPALTTGQPAAQSSPTVTTFGIDFNYRANALATKPLTNAIAPLFTGATQGFTGLYQVNFIVPPPTANLPLCLGTASVPPGAITVQSNLTVSIGSNFSFDGAGICVSPRQ